jgi:hypothetical protein
MVFAITNKVDIELLIDGNRAKLFEKITQNVLAHKNLPPEAANASYVKVGNLVQSNASVVLSKNISKHPNSSTSSKINKLSPVYKVYQSELIGDRSERIFYIRNSSFEFSYYAFIFDSYLVCPAFLAKKLKITKYACLNVFDIIDYYYIFVKNEPQLDITSDSFGHLGTHNFSLSSRNHEVIRLNSENKDIVHFILAFPAVKSNRNLLMEWNDFSKTSGSRIEYSKEMPSYSLISRNLFSDFESRHKPFYKEGLDFAGTGLIYLKSESYSEIKEYFQSSITHPDDIEYGKIFKNTPYVQEDNILNEFIKHLKTNYDKCKEGQVENFFCSVIAILQSSGYGKSKLIERLGSRTPTFYSSLQYEIGFPGKSFFLTRLIEKLEEIMKCHHPYCHMNNVSAATYIYILRILFIILKSKSKNEILKKNVHIDEIENVAAFSDYIGSLEEKREIIFKVLFDEKLENLCKSGSYFIFDGEETLELKDIKMIKDFRKFEIYEYSTENLEIDVMRTLEKMDSFGLPSIFVIDEAKGLDYKKIKDKKFEKYEWIFQDYNAETRNIVRAVSSNPYKVFRRIFRMFKYTWLRLILVIIGARGQISVILPEPPVLDPALRETASNDFIENFVLVQTYNVNSDLSSLIREDIFSSRNDKSWKDFLTSNFRIEEFFKIGRPLIYATFVKNAKRKLEADRYDLNVPFKRCGEFWFLAKKFFGCDFRGQMKYEQSNDDALLYSMFNFAFGANFLPSHLSKEDLVENYLMTLVKYLDEDGTSYEIGSFLPEGVFSVISAKYFVDFPDSLSDIFSSSVKFGLCDTNNYGELLVQYILIRNAFYCIDPIGTKMIRKLAFQPIYLKNFLLSLAGNDKLAVVEEFIKSSSLKKAMLSFSYFEHFPKNPILEPFDLMARSLAKGSAVTLDSLYFGIDIMIPLVLDNGKLSFLGIKVKFVKENEVNWAIDEALENMVFSKMFEKESDRPYGLIIFVLGDYDLKVQPKNSINLDVFGQKNEDNHNVLTFKGIPHSFQKISNLFKDSYPKNLSYLGICGDYLKACDHLYELIHEVGDDQLDGS